MLGLPYLFREDAGFNGQIIATEPTAQLGKLLMQVSSVSAVQRIPGAWLDQSASDAAGTRPSHGVALRNSLWLRRGGGAGNG